MNFSIGDVAQLVTIVTSLGALFFAARAAFHTKVLQISINGRMEKLLQATAEAAAARAREETIQQMILDSVLEASESETINAQQLEDARRAGFSEGRLHEVEATRLYKRRKAVRVMRRTRN